MKKSDLKMIMGREWTHLRAEDTDAEQVFRPSTYIEEKGLRFRGLPETFMLRNDGTLIEAGSGPTDARQESEGTWKLEDGKLAFYSGSETEPSRILDVVSVEKDRLVVKKL